MNIEILLNGRNLFPEMLKSIKEAQKYVYLETYILAQDKIGDKFKKALIKKAQEGVKVVLVYDAIGSMYSRNWFFNEMVDKGVDVLCFNPILLKFNKLRYIRGWHNRDHRKLMVVDDDISYIGGHNIADAYIKELRDTHIKITGELSLLLKDSFLESMRIVKNDLYYKKSHFLSHLLNDNRSQEGEKIQFLRDLPSFKYQFIRDKYLDYINQAQKYIYLTTAFFIPDKKFIRALLSARRRGVVVKLLVSDRTDVLIADLASKHLYAKLLAHDIQIFIHQGYIHAKTGVFDDVRVIIGSANLDYRSFRHTYEANLFFDDSKLAPKFRKIFEDDLINSTELDFLEWEKRHWLKKVSEQMAFWFRELL